MATKMMTMQYITAAVGRTIARLVASPGAAAHTWCMRTPTPGMPPLGAGVGTARWAACSLVGGDGLGGGHEDLSLDGDLDRVTD
jgi:hypothetical protein